MRPIRAQFLLLMSIWDHFIDFLIPQTYDDQKQQYQDSNRVSLRDI